VLYDHTVLVLDLFLNCVRIPNKIFHTENDIGRTLLLLLKSINTCRITVQFMNFESASRVKKYCSFLCQAFVAALPVAVLHF